MGMCYSGPPDVVFRTPCVALPLLRLIDLFVASRCHLDIGLCAYMYSDVHFYGRRESEFQSGMNSYVDRIFLDLFLTAAIMKLQKISYYLPMVSFTFTSTISSVFFIKRCSHFA